MVLVLEGVGAEESTYGWDLKSWFMGGNGSFGFGPGGGGGPGFKKDLDLRRT